ncbi:MAG: AAA family ATPase [Patescibacteria group bacterium]|jgi:AAA15 family ATPase/GTPase
MKLNRVEIKNFKSIKNITVNFEPACRVLVGINESGKSNILNALSFLRKDSKPVKKDDLRQELPDEDPIEEAYIRFVFKFEKPESDKLLETVSTKILANVKNPEIVLIGEKVQSVKNYCATRNEGLYTADILDEEKSFKYWSVNYRLIAGWKKLTSACPQDFSIEIKGQKCILSQYKLIRAADFTEIPVEYLEDAKIADLAAFSGETIIAITEENLPDTLFWKYDENNLLPSSVKIEEFSANPDTCVPLRNMFTLAGIAEISTSIASAKARGNNQFQNYLDGIAKKTTTHFRNVWKEYKDIKFSLRLNADQIEPGVKEKNTLDFSKRSDGFKRFVTFLLMISVNVKTDDLVDTLLLIDEPEMSLHPTGARYLREELIKISKTNYVVYSTHSIFMIDSGDISRHYIVKKKDEITTIESAKESNIADEEVLYNALGHSVFAVLKEKNIIFEGWNDKHLFLVAIQGATAVLKNKFKDFSICHAKGVGTIKTITPMIELAQRDCLIVSDSDKAAKNQQKIYKLDKGFGEWKNYQDIDASIEATTGEDFIKNDFITKQIKTILSGSSMPEFDQATLSDRNKLALIFKWLTDNGMTAEQANETINKVKNSIFENLKPQNIEDSYSKILEGISL